MSDQNNSVFEQRVASLRELLDQNDLDALIVSHDDEYLSYELNEDEERLKYITGFSGSAGYAVITRNDLKINEESIEINQDNSENSTLVERDCAVFVDGRYVVQVKEQIDTDIFQDFDLAKVKPAKWISSVMPKNSTVGIDINCVSYKEYISIIIKCIYEKWNNYLVYAIDVICNDISRHIDELTNKVS